jgi:hypothetical protein
MPTPTPAERLDAAVDSILVGARAYGDTLSDVAALVHAALPPIPPGAGFEARLARRLGGAGMRDRLRVAAVATRRQLTPVRLITAGALSSAAVGVTAFAVWRTSRRQPAQRLLHR